MTNENLLLGEYFPQIDAPVAPVLAARAIKAADKFIELLKAAAVQV